ncbi:DUF5134 domain-containing protein [Mycobacterium sp. PDNC021]|uniref:DUF5134 domain-containing protein n=1 Tax=Mycobacterium sp. PDNC021 TaxID=3391399 RepID=UPI003AAC3E20
MIADLTVRWVVTLLFVLSAAECVHAVVAGRRAVLPVVGQGLHLVMALAMAVMAWPYGAALPTVAPTIFFLLATLWFVAAAIIDPDHWAGSFYHAAMMLAMSWMYAVMNGHILPGQNLAASQGAATMPGMDMPATAVAGTSVQAPPYIAGLNWIWTVAFAVAAVWWIYRSFAVQRSDRNLALGAVGQAMMAVGMAVMFAVML